ncbi:MAG: hypothetical protein MI747_04270 [Desulfobacterales bacterium]|nr:hypothetical protein [Desulfobacterales bacterium]
MKIIHHTQTLSSTRQYAETIHTQVSQTMDFQGLLSQAQGPSTVPEADPAASLQDELAQELARIRQMLEEIILEMTQAFQAGESRVAGRQAPSLPSLAVEVSRKVTQTQTTTESTRFAAHGVVHTADGRQLDFALEMGMDYSFTRTTHTSQTMEYVFLDPLVIHSKARAPELDATTFTFDMDLDGNTEELQSPRAGSGFLALDRNQDGKINDGGELFGPATGHGFAELATHDLDGNQWIDENDPIFNELLIWNPSTDPDQPLTRLKDAGIGAISLAAVDTPFDLRDNQGNIQARIKRSSVALEENGGVRPVQEMDYIV